MKNKPYAFSIEALSELLKSYSSTKILLVRGKHSYNQLDELFAITEILENYDTLHFYDFSPNPLFEEALVGIHEAIRFKPDIILCIGGGSVMDMAKIIKAGIADISGLKDFFSTGRSPLVQTEPPIIAIPTTAGTGSESTHFAVVYKENKKFSLTHPKLKPCEVILDYRLAQNAPFSTKSSAAIDALSQCIEGIWSKNCNNESFKYGLKAFQLIYNNIEDAIINNQRASMHNLCLGAYYAGKTIDISKTTAPHAFSYKFTNLFNIPHGQAVAITLPFFIRFNCNTNTPLSQLHALALERFLKVLNSCNINSISEFEKWLWDIYHKLNIRIPIKNLIAPFAKFNLEFIQSVNFERLKNNPRMVNPEQISKPLYDYIINEFSL